MTRSLLTGAVCAFVLIDTSAIAPAFADVVGAIRGTVAGATAGVIVRIDGDGVRQTATTAADGSFAFARVPFGRYTVAAEAAGGERRAVVDLTTGAVIDIVLAPPGAVIGSVRATTRGVRGTPVSDNTLSRTVLTELPRAGKLDDVVQTMPGIVRFSYDEPVAHGFHGITYELDGVPLPRNTSQNFSDLFDVRDAQSIDVLTGAFPAEFGGSRQGAVVNVRSRTGGGADPHGLVTLGAGTLDSGELRISRHIALGSTSDLLVASNLSRTSRAIDTPARDAIHDAGSLGNAFVRLSHRFDERTTLALLGSAQNATFQIPYSTLADAFNLNTSPPGTDDVQLEQDRFIALAFNRTSADGNGYVQIAPWARGGRLSYNGDPATDRAGTLGTGLTEDRRAAYAGVRAAVFRSSAHHGFKAGIDAQRENVTGTTVIALPSAAPFVDANAQAGSAIGAYIQDQWSPSARVGMQLGLRYDASSGYVHGTQLSPRIGMNYALDARDTLHVYFGRLYAAPSVEDTRRDAVVAGGATSLPVYDLQPERDSYEEVGIARRIDAGTFAYVNGFRREARNVLDTTQLAQTPIFAVFNNAVGRVWGVEGRVQSDTPRHSAYLSFTISGARAGGVSGGLFLLDPDPAAAAAAASDVTLQPEDHDQKYAGKAAWIQRFGADHATYASVAVEYGTGFPVQFQNGNDRLPAHTTFDVALGRHATHGGLGAELAAENVFERRYVIKSNNGFNTTQWNAPRRVVVRLTAPW